MQIYKKLLSGGLSSIMLFLLLLPACKQDGLRAPLENDGTAPGPVSNIQVENLNGGARITFTIPDDPDLLYVQANYDIRKGVKQEMTASYYKNSLTIQGFADTAGHQVDLFAIDRSGNKSRPVSVTVKPLISPIQQTYNSLSYLADFGGIHLQFQNESKANIVISVMVKDSTGDWVDYDKAYTSQAKGDFSTRGLPASPTTFGVFVQDRWNNRSDTLVKELTPFFETELDVNKFKEVDLPTDIQNIIWNFSDLWNAGAAANIGGFHSPNDGDIPGWFTMDLGVTAKLSRFKMWGLTDGREYTGGHVKHFQIWGSLTPAQNGSWDGWTLLQDCIVIKPSGSSSGQLSNEDIEYAESGFEFKIPIDAPAVRFIRIKALGTFSLPEGGKGSFWVKRLAFWGSPQP